MAYLGFGKGGSWRARGARAYSGGLGAEPPAGSRGRAPGRGVRGPKPPEAETLFAFERSVEAANSPFLNSETQKITASHQMQSHMVILIAYCIGIKKPSNIVEFCNSCWKTAKNAPFHIKSPQKIFMVGPKGGPSHRGPPPKYATDR